MAGLEIGPHVTIVATMVVDELSRGRVGGTKWLRLLSLIELIGHVRGQSKRDSRDCVFARAKQIDPMLEKNFKKLYMTQPRTSLPDNFTALGHANHLRLNTDSRKCGHRQEER